MVRTNQTNFHTPAQSGWCVVYKAMRLDEDGTLRSFIFPRIIYKLGKLYTQKARPNHGGGFYAYLTSQEALEFGRKWGPKYGADKVAIVKCLARGGPVCYDNGKLAFSQLRPIEIVMILELN